MSRQYWSVCFVLNDFGGFEEVGLLGVFETLVRFWELCNVRKRRERWRYTELLTRPVVQEFLVLTISIITSGLTARGVVKIFGFSWRSRALQ